MDAGLNGKARVVVTGMGAVTALGMDVPSLWARLLEGRTGIARLTQVALDQHKTVVGAEVNSAALGEAMAARGVASGGDRAVDLAMLAADQALHEALGSAPLIELRPVATLVGSGIGCPTTLMPAVMAFGEKGLRAVRPTTIPRSMTNALSAQIAMRYRLTGANYVIVSACTSSTNALGVGFRMIRDGYAQQVLCVGVDTPFDPFVYAAWNNLGVMSKQTDPARACRPFDAARDGCVLGEGAGAILLESQASAATRGVTVHAELAGYGESSDAEHVTRPSVAGQSQAIRAALASAGVLPAEVGFINAHGTATAANDETEAASIVAALGEAAAGIPVASNKSYFGHLLGASGIVESIVTILGLKAGRVPANLNLANPDPKCNVCFVGDAPQAIVAPIAMKNSFGFGGGNGVLILRRWA